MAASRGNRRRTILVLLVLTAVTLITLDLRADGDGGVVGSIRNFARDALAPVQDATGGITDPIGDWFDGVFDAGDLKAENARLKRELAEARGSAAQAEADRAENEALRGQLGLEWLGATPTVAAEVINTATGNFESTVQIDRGTDDGIAVGMPVVTGDGLVGTISQASRRRATVTLITDSNIGVGARLVDTGTPGVLRGSGDRDELSLQFVDPEVPVAEDELVVTSGVDNAAYPGNLPIGRVVRAERSGGALQQDITVAPLADLGRLQFVQVLLWPTVPGG